MAVFILKNELQREFPPALDAHTQMFMFQQKTQTGPGPKARVGAAPTKAAAFVLC